MHIKRICYWIEVSSSFRRLYLKGKKFEARIKFNYKSESYQNHITE